MSAEIQIGDHNENEIWACSNDRKILHFVQVQWTPVMYTLLIPLYESTFCIFLVLLALP
jgi:hypothetical protein